jgi:thiol-disulfide isomerase/thioredoxin
MRKWIEIILLSIVLAGCGGGTPTPAAVKGQATAIEEFPVGPGRGFAEARVVGSAQPVPVLKAGDIPPDFTFRLEDGRYTRLSELKGRPVLINFWATWCGPCRQEMPEIVNAAAEKENLIVLAVNQEESLSLVEPFAEEFKMELPVLLDPEGKVGWLYQARGLPTTVFVDADGKVASVFIGRMTPQALTEHLAEIL